MQLPEKMPYRDPAGYAKERKDNDLLLSSLKNEFTLRKAVFEDIGDYIAPYAHDFNIQSSAENQRPASWIINETPCEALEIAVSGLVDGTCNPTEEWLAFETSNPTINKIHSVQSWTQEVSQVVLGEINKSNWNRIAPEIMRAVMAFGNGAVVVKEEYQESCVRFYPATMGSYYIGRDARGNVSYFAREMRMTAGQMVQDFKIENVSDKVRQAYKEGREQNQFDVIHVIKPNKLPVPGSMLSKDKAFKECYYEPCKEADRPLMESGYDQFPVAAPCWIPIGNRPWGVGPGHMALPGSKTLQAREIDQALAGEKQINPPLIAPPGINLAAISMLPGALNIASDSAGAQGLRALHETRFDLSAGNDGIARVEERIRNAFWNHIFLMITNDNGAKMTAREVVERAREKKLALTPILSIIDNLLKPIVSMVYEYASKQGKLPPYPPEMKGQTLKVIFKSTLAKAAQMEKSALTADHILNFTLPIAQARPDIMDNIDWDAVERETGAFAGMPASQYLSPEKVAELRAARAQQQQQMQQMEQEAHAAATAKSLSETDTSGNNALTQLASAAQQ